MSIKNAVLGMGITGVVITSSLTVNITPAVSQTPKSDKVTFLCTKIYDPASSKQIPATLVWIPEIKEHRRLIGWKSAYFGKEFTPEKRCQIVTKKFQEKYDSGNLKYIQQGTSSNGYSILCGVKNEQDSCDDKSMLFTLKPHNNKDEIKADLSAVMGKGSEILIQTAGDRPINFKEFLDTRPLIKK